MTEKTQNPQTRTSTGSGDGSAVVPRKMSWGAVIAGGLVALTVQLLLSLLGVVIGFGIIQVDPQPGGPVAVLAGGSAVWWIVTSLVSLFIGGWVAGRMAGALERIGGALHGLVTWSLATVLTLILLGTGVGLVLGGLIGFVGQTADAVQTAVASVDDTSDGPVLDQQTRDRLEREVRATLEATGVRELQPDELEQRGEEVQETVTEGLRAAATNPDQAREEIMDTIEQVWGETREVVSAADKDAVVSALAARTDLTESEAREAVDGWAETLEEARTEAAQTGERLAEQARIQAERAVDALSWASLWAFLGLLVGALCAMAGGVVGARSTVA